MITKTAEKARPQEEPRPGREPGASRSLEEMHTTFQCHTLCQILWRHIAVTRPWLLHMPQPPHPSTRPVAGFGAPPWTRVQPGAS